MRRLLALAISLLLLPLASATLPDAPGIPVACRKSPTEGPCKHLDRVIHDTHIQPGQEMHYSDRDYVADGTVVVGPGGSAIVENASITFLDTSDGFVVQPGGRLVVTFSDLLDGGNSSFGIVADASSTLDVTHASLRGGSGAIVRTSNATLVDITFEAIPVALRVEDATLAVEDSLFLRNDVAVRLTGGVPTLRGNRFEYNRECVHDFRTDPTIEGNVFLHCIIGIWHEESHSTIRDNQFVEDGDPGSVAMVILNGRSPLIENNDISNFARGIVVQNARAYVRNNTIHGNQGPGIVVDTNVDTMDVRGNVVTGNAGPGIVLVNASGVTVERNVVEANAGHGISIVDARGPVALATNRVLANTGDGIHVASSPGVSFSHDEARGNTGAGFRFLGALGIVADGIESTGNGNGILLLESAGSLVRANASGNQGHGFLVDASTLVTTTSIPCARAIANGGHGVLNRGGLETARRGWFEDNDGAGVRTEDFDGVVDASQSWWGHPSGPTTLTNPNGGDEAEGQVIFLAPAGAPHVDCTPG